MRSKFVFIFVFTTLFFGCNRRTIPLSEEELLLQKKISQQYPMAQVDFEHDRYSIENNTGTGIFFISISNSNGDTESLGKKDSTCMYYKSLKIALVTSKILSHRKCYNRINIKHIIYKMKGASYFLIYDYDATFCISTLDSINIGRFNK